jgi:Holliday junction resolvasome RuvABC endonuclease subunit
MKILGVDPGSRAAGWAVVDFAPSPALVDAGVIRPPRTGTFAERLFFLYSALARVVTRDRPDAAAAALAHGFVAARRGASFAPTPRAFAPFPGIRRGPVG